MECHGVILSHETIRFWCYKFATNFQEVIRKRERKPTDKWHLDEMTVKVNGEHQPTRRKEKVLIKFKSPHGVQRTLSLMGKVRNIFADDIQKMLKNSGELLLLLLNQSGMRLPQGFLLSETQRYRLFKLSCI
ncbi:IS6 family transposase domain protein (plasmid) [Candidatus Trichorickettsia mobilis]|nr:IS6 family transposase domain protein [Candidatus Trichorickettsia mobilis]